MNLNIILKYMIFVFNIGKILSDCGLKFLKKPQRILVKQNSDIHKTRILIEEKWENIRIHLDYSAIENNIDKLNKTDIRYLQYDIMPKAKEIFEKIIKVRRNTNKLKLSKDICEDIPIPEIYKQIDYVVDSGVDADLIIFVRLDHTGFYRANRIEAAATYCLQDERTKRPIAGYIIFKPDINAKNTTYLDYMTWLAIHEMTHILVFNDGIYGDFVDENLQPLNITNVLGTKLVNNKTINFLKTKNVVNKGKKHFNCSNLEGIPLEFMGGVGTSGSHWSKKIMNTDFMIGDSYGENMISEISLALFEDSGWYKVDYEMANLFLWGKNKGCDFLDFDKKCIREKISNTNNNNEINNDSMKNKPFITNKNQINNNSMKNIYNNTNNNQINDEGDIENKDINDEGFLKNYTECKDNITNSNNNFSLISQINKNSNERRLKFIENNKKQVFNLNNYETDFSPEYCSKLNYPVCSISNIFRATCKIKRYKNPLLEFVYFKDKNVGGLNNLMNKCPIAIEDKVYQNYYSSSCRKGIYRSDQLPIEKICPECSCFMSNLVPIKEETKDDDKKKVEKINKDIVEKNTADNYQNKKLLKKISYNQDHLTPDSKDLEKKNKEKENEIKKEIDMISENDIGYYDEGENIGENEEENKNKLKRIDKKFNIISINKPDGDLIPILTEDDYRAMCFEFICIQNKLYAIIHNKKYECIENKITIPGYRGKIVCPTKNVLCHRKYKCKFGCIEKYEGEN